MDENTKLIITLKQLKELRSSKDEERKIEIYAEVLSQIYKEKGAGEAIVGGVGKGAGILWRGAAKGAGTLIDAIDKATEPPSSKKKDGKP